MSTADISAAPNPRNEPQEEDVLVPFEIQNIPPKYREYYKIKRNNFFACIQLFPEIWKYYVLLDDDLPPFSVPIIMWVPGVKSTPLL